MLFCWLKVPIAITKLNGLNGFVTLSVKTQLKSFFAVFYKKNHPSYSKEYSVEMITFISLILTE